MAVLNKQKQPDLMLKQILDSFLPARDLRSTELKRIFCCSHQLVYRLAPQFVVARAPLKKDGPNAFTVFKRESIYKFMASRFMGLKPELN